MCVKVYFSLSSLVCRCMWSHSQATKDKAWCVPSRLRNTSFRQILNSLQCYCTYSTVAGWIKVIMEQVPSQIWSFILFDPRFWTLVSIKQAVNPIRNLITKKWEQKKCQSFTRRLGVHCYLKVSRLFPWVKPHILRVWFFHLSFRICNWGMWSVVLKIMLECDKTPDNCNCVKKNPII